jgi:phage-related protein
MHGVSSVMHGVSSVMRGVSSAMRGVSSVMRGVSSAMRGVSSAMRGVWHVSHPQNGDAMHGVSTGGASTNNKMEFPRQSG